MEVTYFTPGQVIRPGPPLAVYRPAMPAGALGPYLDAYTQPGDLVIELFCQGPVLIHEAVQAGRRALGLNVNRALLLAASLGLTAVERQEVEAAFTRLAEARKGPETLQGHIEGLYRTRCAACGATTVADAFIWERDGDAPLAKRYRCAACGEASPQGAPTDEADRAAAARFAPRGLSYWLLLDRAAPALRVEPQGRADAPHRARAAALLELYTPRNLAAVNDLLLKSDGLTIAPPVRGVLDALLLEALDRATSLRPPDAPDSRPRRLQRPARYVEENVWRSFEHALEAWRALTSTPVSQAPDLETLLAESEAPLAYLAPLSARQAGHALPPACAALILVDPPRPDLAMWHLTALWCHWLWGQAAGAPLLPFLGRRRLDWEGFWHGLRGALAAVAPLLRPEGRLICLFSDEDPVTLEALTLAAASAGYELVGWGAQPPEMRLTWCFDRLSTQRFGEAAAPTPVAADALSRAVAERAADASLNALRLRGEPAAWPTLHAAIYAGLAESGLLAQAATLPEEVETPGAPDTPLQPLSLLADSVRSALDGAPLRQIVPQPTDQLTSQPFWWLDEPLESQAAAPLSDRVELAVAEILRDALAVTEAELQRQVCARFPGPTTPDAPLVRLCLFSYGDEHAPGHWRLRGEDALEARLAETDAVIADLAALGRGLGFEVVLGAPEAGEWAMRWRDESGHVLYAFAVRTTAVLGDLLFAPPPPGLRPSAPLAGGTEGGPIPSRARGKGTIPCLTLPGGRAVLVGYKLRHDPRLREQVERHGWQFLKFRHLRHLVQEVAEKQLGRYAFQAALGLDPIVEQEEAQMTLW